MNYELRQSQIKALSDCPAGGSKVFLITFFTKKVMPRGERIQNEMPDGMK
jgi:hypothetical protein